MIGPPMRGRHRRQRRCRSTPVVACLLLLAGAASGQEAGGSPAAPAAVVTPAAPAPVSPLEQEVEAAEDLSNAALQMDVFKFHNNLTQLPRLTARKPSLSLNVHNVSLEADGAAAGDVFAPILRGTVLLERLQRTEKYQHRVAIRLIGSLTVAAPMMHPAMYTFYLNSRDGSKLWINGALLIDNDGRHPAPVEKHGALYLTLGTHELRVEYFMDGQHPKKLELSFSAPGIKKRVVPTGVFAPPDQATQCYAACGVAHCYTGYREPICWGGDEPESIDDRPVGQIVDGVDQNAHYRYAGKDGVVKEL